MGSKKNLVLASLVSLVMVLSFVIGLVPAQTGSTGQGASAAPGNASVAISVDGVSPVGGSFAIPVGSEQGFSALSLVGGAVSRALSAGEAEWSLATDGAGTLAAPPGSSVATVTAMAPGHAGLYVATADGQVGVANLTFYELKSQDKSASLTSVAITSPAAGAHLLFPTGTSVPLTVTASTDSTGDTKQVSYAYDAALAVYSIYSTTPPYYPAVIPDIATDIQAGAVGAMAESFEAYRVYAKNNVTLVPTSAANTEGLPNSPFDLNLAPGDQWLAAVNDTNFNRLVVETPLPDSFAKAVSIYSSGAIVTLTDPNNPEAHVTVTVPAGLLDPGQEGLLIFAASETEAGLLGSTEAANLAALPTGLLGGAQFVAIDIVYRASGGSTYLNYTDQARLTSHPLVIEMTGLTVPDGANASFLVHPAASTTSGNAAITVPPNGAWTRPSGSVTVLGGAITEEVDQLGVLAPFATPNAPRIVSVANFSPGANNGLAQAYSAGGETALITTENVADTDTVNFTIGGTLATISNVATSTANYHYVVVPPTTPPGSVVMSLPVDVVMSGNGTGGQFTDTLHNGLTYVGPTITTVLNDNGSGSQGAAGDSVTVTGAGFGLGGTMKASLGGINIVPTNIAADGTSFKFVVPQGLSLGAADLAVAVNNVETIKTNAFEVTAGGTPPHIDSVFPTAVFNDGNYMLFISGSNLGSTSKALVTATNVYFTPSAGATPNPATDQPAASVMVNSSSFVVVTTPTPITAGAHDLYVALVTTSNGTPGVPLVSNAVTINFVDPNSSALKITSISPAQGPLAGGNPVTINGSGFPDVVIPATTSAKSATITTGTVLRIEDQTVPATTTQITVKMDLFRGPEQDFTRGPAAINGTITYDPTKLSFNANASFDGANLFPWYKKAGAFSENTKGTIKFVIEGTNQNEITTKDNQITSSGHNASNQENPFNLENMVFDVVSLTPGETIPITLSDVVMADKNAQPLGSSFGPATENGVINVQPPDNTLQVDTVTVTPQSTNVGVGVKLFRPSAATQQTTGPATIDATITFDPAVVSFQGVQPDALLSQWYGKTITAQLQGNNTVAVHVAASGSTNTLITTFDNQITVSGHTATSQENPFTLGLLQFNVIGNAGTNSPLTVASVTLKDASGTAIPAGKENGQINVANAPRVFFGDKMATVTQSTPTQMKVIAPAGTALGFVDVRVEDPNNANPLANFAVKAKGYEYVPVPLTITSISDVSAGANQGKAQAYSIGGETVRVTLNGINAGDTIYSVSIGGKSAAIIAHTATTVDVTVPPADPLASPAPSKAVDVSVSAGSSQATSTGGLTYVGPTVLSVVPNNGSASGGTSVTVAGAGFDTTATASFGGTPLTNVSNTTATSLHGVTGAHANATVDVTVTNGNNFTGTGTGLYTYGPVTNPAVLAVTPAEDVVASGKPGGPFNPASVEYQITNAGPVGSTLNWIVSVDQPWIDLSQVAKANATYSGTGPATVLATVNANANSLGLGQYTATLTFTGGSNGPVLRHIILNVTNIHIDSVTPNKFWLFGGTIVHIVGGGFDAASVVYFGTGPNGVLPVAMASLPAPAAMPSDAVSTATDIYTIAPPLANAGSADAVTADVRIQNPDGTFFVAPAAVTYVQHETSLEPSGGGNMTLVNNTAFYFTRGTGSGEVTIYLNTESAQTAGRAAIFNTPAANTSALLTVPALVAANLSYDNGAKSLATDTIFGIARASMDETYLGTELLPPSFFNSNWDFDVHLYDGAVPMTLANFNAGMMTAPELKVTFNTAANPARLTFPTSQTDLTLLDITNGEASFYSLDSTFSYDYFNRVFLPDTNMQQYESSILKGEFDAANTSTTSPITDIKGGRIYNIGDTYSLRNTGAPTDLITQTLGLDSATNINTVTGGSFVLHGRGISWTVAVYVGKGTTAQITDPTLFVKCNITNLGQSPDLLNVTVPGPLPTALQSQTTLDIVVVAPPGPATAKQLNRIFTLPGALKVVVGQGPQPPWGIIAAALGLLIALIGLGAGLGHGHHGGGGPCFIATAAYGTTLADQIDTLRVFRDTFMLSNPVGTALTDLYYHVSPAIADVVAKSPTLAFLVRMVLVPVIYVAKLFLAMPGVSGVMATMAFGLLTLRHFRRDNKKA